MFDRASNVRLAGGLLEIHYPLLDGMHGVEHNVSLFYNDVSKILIVNQIIQYHDKINILFRSVLYHKPHYIFRSKSYKYNNKNIGLYSGKIPEWLDISWECTEICA